MRLETLGQFLKDGGLSKAELNDDGTPSILYGELYTGYGSVINKVYGRTRLNEKVIRGMKNDVLISVHLEKGQLI